MIINFYFAFVLTLIFIIILPTIIYIYIKDDSIKKKISIIYFCIYLLILFVGTIAEIDIKLPNLIVNFNFSYPWFSSYFLWFNFDIDNLIVNILLMIPVGFFTYSFCKNRKFLKTIIVSICISIIIEIYQTILPVYRNTEILDLILNLLSGTISAIFYKFLQNLAKKQ